ncbi:MAG: threonylcarbamoyl-AMP synthase [Selenomonadaceae bacterium]|nr:threonylcarbamoyl-AMP synthase [Selenomonadaceae bacterium]
MKTLVIKDGAALGAKLLKEGEIVAFPTETVYGLGALFDNVCAIGKIYEAKGRPKDNPLILHAFDIEMAKSVAVLDDKALRLFEKFSPGPITLILPKKENVPMEVTCGLTTVGVRIPKHDAARELIRLAGAPIAAPSANLSGRPSPTSAKMVYEDMNGKISLIIDGDSSETGLESTIFDVGTNTVLRPGAITAEMLEDCLGETIYAAGAVGKDEKPKAPGMKYRHYAPKAKVRLMRAEDFESVDFAKKNTVGALVSRTVAEKLSKILPDENIFCYGQQGNMEEIAANLYEGLAYFDFLPNIELILAEVVEEKGIGVAVMNRLRKAAK